MSSILEINASTRVGAVIDADALNRWLAEPGELSVIDLRDEAAFGKSGEPLFAVNLPAARLREKIAAFVPRKTTRIVLVDGGDGTAARALAELAGLGYENVHLLAGGLPAWIRSGATAGFTPSALAFTLEVRSRNRTPVVEAAELSQLYQAGKDVIVLDSRTVEEYANFHVPGAVSVPGAELVHRFADLVPSPETLVLVSCAGLPRAILGAQTLINAGVPNRVAYLEEGTKGWEQAGLKLENGLERKYAPLTPKAAEFGREHAGRLEKQFGVRRVSAETIAGWLGGAEDRTTFLLDVRTPEEFAAGHPAGALSAPGGQLALGTFRYIGVRGARLVLVDDSGVRAATTAHWLQQRGWEVWIHATDSTASR